MIISLVDEPLNTAPCGFLAFADDGMVTQVNATLLDMLGYDFHELAGQHVERILTIGSRIFYQTHWFPLLRLHGRAEEIFMMLRSRTGDEIGVLVNAIRRDRAGLAYYDCIMLRVSERQKYEEKLLGARRAAEQAAAELEIRARELQQANDLLESQALELQLQQQQLEEQAVALEVTTQELRVANEQLLARAAEAEHLRGIAEDANQAKSAFLAVMSHELRTPLNAIAGYVQLMEMGIHGPVTEAQQDALTRIDRAQRHLLGLINDVLNLSRIESGRVEYAIEAVPVAEVIAAVTPLIEPQRRAKELRLDVEASTGLVLSGDREKIQQILLNLLGNAVKFTPAGGRISIDARPAGSNPDQVLVRVRDTGTGIPPEKLESIFEPFAQVDTSRTRGAEGSGLGLAISRDLARGMAGDLTAWSDPGKGSVFTLVLPRGS